MTWNKHYIKNYFKNYKILGHKTQVRHTIPFIERHYKYIRFTQLFLSNPDPQMIWGVSFFRFWKNIFREDSTKQTKNGMLTN